MKFEDILKQLELEDKPFYRTREVRRIFGITSLTLYKWRREGVLPSVEIQGIHYTSRADLKALCEKGNKSVSEN